MNHLEPILDGQHRKTDPFASNKLLHSAADADIWVAGQRGRRMRIGFTCGAFDLFHVGHLELLERSKSLCDQLLVAVNSDESIRRYKSPLRPIHPQSQRMQVIGGLGCVDAVVLLEEQRPLKLIERWRPDLYIKGGDYSSGGLRSAAAVESYGGGVVLLPILTDQSTTATIRKVAFLDAHECLLRGVQNEDPGRIVFLDRDGTLIRNIPYLHQPERVELLPGVPEGLCRLQNAKYRLVIVTNQQGIGLGYFPMDAFFAVNHALFRLLSPHNVKIDKVYFCPHSFADDCNCRKPYPALIERALTEYQADPRGCWLIGDNESDMAAGKAAGCRTVLTNSGPESVSFAQAVDHILAAG